MGVIDIAESTEAIHAYEHNIVSSPLFKFYQFDEGPDLTGAQHHGHPTSGGPSGEFGDYLGCIDWEYRRQRINAVDLSRIAYQGGHNDIFHG